MSEKDFDLRLVGIISKPHGIKGEVILNIITDYPSTILPGLILLLRDSDRDSLEIEQIKNPDFSVRKSAIVKFKEINNRNDAESLRGSRLYRKDIELPDTNEEIFWIDDLIGCIIENPEGVVLAKVLEVLQGIANDSLLVEKLSDNIKISGVKGKQFYIPLTEEYIKSIDSKLRKIIINKIPEYI
ncbi:MAG: ribosome maturation factor RimM [Actinomycetota bacterium]|nr:ribosome maturation factor RimM [Actinomycetota bacterium]